MSRKVFKNPDGNITLLERPAVSRILSPLKFRGGNHLSGITVTSNLERPTQEEAGASFCWMVIQRLPLFGLASDGVCQASLLPDCWWALTSPFHPYFRLRLRLWRTSLIKEGLSDEALAKSEAVCFLLHFPSGFPAWPLASILPYEVRTFLQLVFVCTNIQQAIAHMSLWQHHGAIRRAWIYLGSGVMSTVDEELFNS